MAFVVEDGTGKPNATSFVTVAAADAYWADRAGSAWAGYSTPAKEAALIAASDYLRNEQRYRWVGTKKTATQSMPWPRVDAVERNGPAIPDTVVPWQVQEAAAILGDRTATGEDLQPDLAAQAVTSETVGPISVTYATPQGVGGVGAQDPTISAVDGLLAPLLRDWGVSGGLVPIEGAYATTWTSVPVPPGYRDREFDYR